MTTNQMEVLDELELQRLEPTRSQWAVAWDAAKLVASLDRDNEDPAVYQAVAYTCLTVAEACEVRLEKIGKTSADDNGDTAADRIRRYLNERAWRVLRTVQTVTA